MTSHAADRTARRFRGMGSSLLSLKLRAVLALGLLLGIGASATGAFWTQTVAVPTTTFTSGTIDLQLNNASGTYAFTGLALADMLPGNSYAAMIPVQNKSQYAKLRYTMDARATGTLGSALTVSVFAGGTASNSSFAGTCSGTALGSAVTMASADQTVVTSTVTDARPAIAAAGSESLCIRVELPVGAASTLAGQSTQATFTFRAKSVQN